MLSAFGDIHIDPRDLGTKHASKVLQSYIPSYTVHIVSYTYAKVCDIRTINGDAKSGLRAGKK